MELICLYTLIELCSASVSGRSRCSRQAGGTMQPAAGWCHGPLRCSLWWMLSSVSAPDRSELVSTRCSTLSSFFFLPLFSSPAKCPTLVSSSPSEHLTVLSPLSSQLFFFLHIFTLDAIICRSGSYTSNRSKKNPPNVADVVLFNSHLIIKIFDCICIIFLSLHAPFGKNQNPSQLCRGLMPWITFIISAKLVSLLTFAILGGVRRVHPSTELPEKTSFFIATLGKKKT